MSAGSMSSGVASFMTERKNLKKKDADMVRLYSIIPPGAVASSGKSSGSTSRAALSVSCDSGLPARNASVLRAFTDDAAMPPNAKPASVITIPEGPFSRAIRIPQVTIAMSSSRRRLALKPLAYSMGRVSGTKILSINSSGARCVCRYMRSLKNSLAAISRVVPSTFTRVKIALQAIRTGLRSEIGEALATLPPMAATLRIGVPANHLSCASNAL
mmetsp:Transcript_35222/g.51678  ORF Transcript_35222/g.51678 Transcript_35222/m.51678 type:complete len:215 (+) Transcript_35222:1414-2058(+)